MSQSRCLERVGPLPSIEGVVAETWRLPSGRYAAVITEPPREGWELELARRAAATEKAGANLVARLEGNSPAFDYARDRDPALEETRAFECDVHGRIEGEWEIVAAQGDGSRQRVLEELASGVDWRRDSSSG